MTIGCFRSKRKSVKAPRVVAASIQNTQPKCDVPTGIQPVTCVLEPEVESTVGSEVCRGSPSRLDAQAEVSTRSAEVGTAFSEEDAIGTEAHAEKLKEMDIQGSTCDAGVLVVVVNEIIEGTLPFVVEECVDAMAAAVKTSVEKSPIAIIVPGFTEFDNEHFDAAFDVVSACEIASPTRDGFVALENEHFDAAFDVSECDDDNEVEMPANDGFVSLGNAHFDAAFDVASACEIASPSRDGFLALENAPYDAEICISECDDDDVASSVELCPPPKFGFTPLENAHFDAEICISECDYDDVASSVELSPPPKVGFKPLENSPYDAEICISECSEDSSTDIGDISDTEGTESSCETFDLHREEMCPTDCAYEGDDLWGNGPPIFGIPSLMPNRVQWSPMTCPVGGAACQWEKEGVQPFAASSTTQLPQLTTQNSFTPYNTKLEMPMLNRVSPSLSSVTSWSYCPAPRPLTPSMTMRSLQQSSSGCVYRLPSYPDTQVMTQKLNAAPSSSPIYATAQMLRPAGLSMPRF